MYLIKVAVFSGVFKSNLTLPSFFFLMIEYTDIFVNVTCFKS